MAFVLNSEIVIGAYQLTGGVNSVNIKKSVKSIIDTAVIKIPALGRIIERNGVLPLTSIETAMVFKEGDKVEIKLGYNGELETEFIGFIRRVNLSTPISIELEGYSRQLRMQNISASWKKVTVREVLERITQGTDITLSPAIPKINLTNFSIANRNGLFVLEYLKEKLLLCIYFNGSELYAGLEEAVIKDTTIYKLGWNVIKSDRLKIRNGSDNKVRVRLVTKSKGAAKRVLFEAGDIGGAVVERHILFNRDSSFLQNKANEFLKQLKYDGYEGSITAFLQPYCEPSYAAVIQDKKYNRSGKYFVTSTEVEFGMKGARRIVEISYRLDDPSII